MTKMKYVCKRCGSGYESYKDNTRYCSAECKKKDNELYLTCEYCGVSFRVIKSVYEDHMSGKKKHIYCSKICCDKGKITKVKKICEHCAKEFEISNCFADIQKYCSRKCYDEYRISRAKEKGKQCPICNRKFIPKNDAIKFCSKECRGISDRKRINCICSQCGKSFERKESEVIKNKKHYCSKECFYDSKRWAVSDIEVLRKHYRNTKLKDIQDLLSKKYSISAIKGKAQALGLGQSRLWTQEEEQILINSYPTMRLCDVMKLLPKRTVPSIMGKARTLKLKGMFYITKIYRKEDVEYLKNNYLELSNEQLAVQLNRTPSSISQKLCTLSLYRPYEIKKEGYKNLKSFMRERLIMWRTEVREEANYTCCLSGERSNIVVHHCRGFSILFEEVIDILDFPIYESFETYKDSELIQFVDMFLNIQEYYHAYVCITDKIHKLFHKEYGYGDNTEDQWGEFASKYMNGYYNKIS